MIAANNGEKSATCSFHLLGIAAKCNLKIIPNSLGKKKGGDE